jgi:hypothetical protein
MNKPVRSNLTRLVALVGLLAVSAHPLVASSDGRDDVLSTSFHEKWDLLRSTSERDVVPFETVKTSIGEMLEEINAVHRHMMAWDESYHQLRVFLDQLERVCRLDKTNCGQVFELIELTDAKFDDLERNLDNYLSVCQQRQKEFCPDALSSKLKSILIPSCIQSHS